MHSLLGRRSFVGLVATLPLFTGCATIIDGAKSEKERSTEIMWGYVVLDVLLTGVIGLIIDLATGAIYERKKEESQNEVVRVALCPTARASIAKLVPHGQTRLVAAALKDHVPHCQACVDAIARRDGEVHELHALLRGARVDTSAPVIVVARAPSRELHLRDTALAP